MSEDCDVIVLGGGAAGENAAWYASDNGFEVALVEHELVGGECSYWACMPSKALLRPGEVLAAARRVPGAADAVTGEVDAEATLASRDAFASHWDDRHQAEWLEATGAVLVRGHGRLAGERKVVVDAADGGTRTLRARRGVVVATGSAPTIPPIDGLADIELWDSRGATAAKAVPRRLLVLGGGVVGVEMAQAFRWLGAEQVTIVQRQSRLVPREEPFVGERLAEAFAEAGITVLLDTTAVRAERDGSDGPVTLTLDRGDELQGDDLLVATGRRPRTEDVGLDSVGLEPGSTLETDDRLRVRGVDGDWLYAVGDVNGRAPFTHHGKYQARLVGDALAGKPVVARADRDALVRVVFTDPQVAAVGLTASQARQRGIRVRELQVDVSDVAGGSLRGKGVSGPVQLVVDQQRRTVVGATFLGPGTGDMLHAATIAIVSGVTLDELWHAVPAFPTVSEVWLRLLEAERGIS